MTTTPKSLRLHVGIFGRTNVGKSSFLNMVAGQDVAIVSAVPGTTTDVVEKPMELLPIGPVVFLDTAGVDDASELAALRAERTRRIFDRADVVVIVLEAGTWTSHEEEILQEAGRRNAPVILVVNKVDLAVPEAAFLAEISAKCPRVLACSSVQPAGREQLLSGFKQHLLDACPEEFLASPPLVGDLLKSGTGLGLAVLVVPIDLQAPRGRLILPQVQTIRDSLDSDAAVAVVKEREYAAFLERLREPPDLAVCDSQVALKMVADTPRSVPCTTFSILFARNKGDLVEMARGAAVLATLRREDRVLIAESCSHHAIEDDIGRVKIPRWLRQYAGVDLRIDSCAGRDFPRDLADYRLVIHCGGCMITRREMLARMQKAREAGVAITNYGVAISVLQGVIERTLSPFPAALDAYRRERARGAEAAARAPDPALAGAR
ncbi:MAG TPA: [FeFe] hydrogenase H-cluster maturation GTPase HydF [Spirochaetia bacterium]|nr:[FeFe] hydrogenase H-cluster maturation GTPase HydF [Spirochaetia bacterium]